MHTKHKITMLLLAVCLVFAVAGTAYAQTGVDSYRSAGEQVQGTIQAQGDNGSGEEPVQVAAAGDDGGALPFTGLDVALILGVGGVLLAVGLATRRLTRHADTA